VAAGSLTYADALRLVRRRGELMKQAGEQSPGLMAAVLGLDEDLVSRICLQATEQGGVAQVANDNCPGQVVISGDRLGMEQAMTALTAAGAKKIVPLAVSIAAHSPLMKPAADELRAAIETTPIAPPRIPVIGNTTAQPLVDSGAIRQELTAQLTGSVRWTASIQTAASLGVGVYVEIGPGDVLVGLVKRIERKAARYTTGLPDALRTFVGATQPVDVEQ
jgi:[acyl-carrier-protein] S-malonyltransferase